jgi:hypothetical protein
MGVMNSSLQNGVMGTSLQSKMSIEYYYRFTKQVGSLLVPVLMNELVKYKY